ncbi:hypothetical protein CDL12_21514 [Handroanthus impetiginosus]|uniref:Uncharacterized protein n=1 Tax=Handroanthus impetiginosus TaxID=429701 RepID=A0A2G9GKZ7_9LAMI|nr:hypothetical protein CDL12_21514 [Handroanthus impetiginosus]
MIILKVRHVLIRCVILDIIAAVDLKQSSLREEGETSEISGSFLAYLASALLLFTIFYNVLFLTVIKPSIDEGEPVLPASMNKDSQEVALSRREELPIGP